MTGTMQPLRRAGFFLRALALAVDAILFLVGYVGILFAIYVIQTDPTPTMPERWMALAFSIVLLVYTSSEIVWGATVGKLVFHLRIRSQSGEPADFWRLLLRWSTKQSPWIVMLCFVILGHPVFRILEGFILLILLCGCLAAMNDDKLAWHDQWSGTAVWKMQKVQPLELGG